MTKWCTRWEVDAHGNPMKVSDVSVVDDDHQFGASGDGFFHVEAQPSIYTVPKFTDHDMGDPASA